KTAYNDDPQDSAATSQVAAGTLSNTVLPSISGTPAVGNSLSANHGSWTPTPDTYAYQWQVSADGSTGWTNATGAGATTNSYTVASADLDQYLRVAVTASDRKSVEEGKS